MNSKVFLIVIAVALFCLGLFSGYFIDRNLGKAVPTNVVISYIYPAISDIKILPNTTIPNQFIGNNIKIRGCPDEYRPASFAVYSKNDLSVTTITASNLSGPKGVIGKEAVDIRVVKCWYQAGDSTIYNKDLVNIKPVLVPELLLKDDSLVKAAEGEDYVKLDDNSYRWISQKTAASSSSPIPLSSFPVKDDAATLQPVNIPGGTNKQFWITLHIPSDALAGAYIGTITVGSVETITINVDVLPFTLANSNLIHSVYYAGNLASSRSDGLGSIGFIKNENQLAAEFTDMYSHGITNPCINQPWSRQADLNRFMQIMQAAGFTKDTLYYRGLFPEGGQSPADVAKVLNHMARYGITDVYFYGKDEATGTNLTDQRAAWASIRNAGGKIFAAGYATSQVPPGNHEGMGSLQDLQVQNDQDINLIQRQIEAAKWHSSGNQIMSYNYPQMGLELPETYRRNYGLMLWQANYDGEMDFSYQWAFGNVWNDWDDPENIYKDHVMAYPTSNGVIDTIQWEGFREGVTDLRYLATLQATITEAKTAGKDTSAAETWLGNLKQLNLTKCNLDSVRDEMISNILSLK